MFELKAPTMARRLRELLPDAVVVLLLIVVSGGISLAWGQDISIDLLGYHFYNGYALVHGRLDYDFAPAALRTYLNPVLDAGHYLGIVHLPPRVFGFLLGAFQGLNAVLIFLMARRLLERGTGSRLLAVLAGVLAVAGPNARSLAGTTTGDTTVSVPALLALLLVLGDQRFPDRAIGCPTPPGRRFARRRRGGPEAHHGHVPDRPGSRRGGAGGEPMGVPGEPRRRCW